MKRPTKSDAIRLIAQDEGFHHSNEYFVQRCHDVFGLTVTSDQVCHSIGRRKHRVRFIPKAAKSAAYQLLDACSYDKALCRQALEFASR